MHKNLVTCRQLALNYLKTLWNSVSEQPPENLRMEVPGGCLAGKSPSCLTEIFLCPLTPGLQRDWSCRNQKTVWDHEVPPHRPHVSYDCVPCGDWPSPGKLGGLEWAEEITPALIFLKIERHQCFIDLSLPNSAEFTNPASVRIFWKLTDM